MKKVILSTMFMLLVCSVLFSQKDPIKWGKVPAEDLAMTTYDADPDAGAVVLCDYGNIRFKYDRSGTGYEFIRHKRIKVLNRSGFDQADVEVAYLASQSFNNFKAQIFAPDGTKVELSKNDIFEEKVNKSWRKQKFNFPNVQEGSVIEFKYTIKSNYMLSLRSWYFQEDIPIRWSELRFEMLTYFHYSTVLKGGLFPVVNEQKNGNETIQGGGSVPTTIKRWVIENAPSLKPESHTACYDDYRSKMVFQLLSINIPGEFTESIEWPGIAKSLQDSEYFGRQYLKKGTSKKVVEAAASSMAAASTPLEKVQAAYDFVNQNVKWNGYYWYDTFGDLDEVLEKGEGYSAELNLMVLALLRSEKIKAFPVVISTRSNGKLNPYYPLIIQFDHTIVLAEIDGKEYWIDAGDPLRPLGLLAKESLNMQGLLINDKEGVFRWAEIKPQKASDVIYSTVKIDADGILTGSVKCSHKNYSALYERGLCGESNGKKVWENRLAENFSEALIAEMTMENQTDFGKALKGEMNINLPEAGMVSGDLIYVSPTIYTKYAENPFKGEGRVLPVEFAHPFSEQVITSLTIPEGFSVDGLPENIRVALPDKAGSFSYRVSESQGKIQVTSKVDLNKTFFLPEEYQGLKDFFSLVEEKMGEQIVLKKRT